MRLLTQDLRAGEVRIVPAPTPVASVRGVLIRSLASLVSAGTERMLVDFGRANLLDKARQQPDRVRDVIDKALAEGVVETVDAVRSKLSQPIALGYANAGIVIATGRGVDEVSIGDLVASNGPHADVVDVPATMVAKVPAGVSPEHACFATVAAVGLEGLRLANCTLGERVVVTGLGLIGLITVQLLRAQGCEVIGIDPDGERRLLAEAVGAATSEPGDAAEAAVARFSRDRGVDAVLICASTKSSDPVTAAARMCRQRGRIVLVGVTGLELERSAFYEKELSFQVSCSYGPGRYDSSYEGGTDYPYGLVRWTAGRNMEAVLDLAASGRLDLEALISHRFAFEDAAGAYTALVEDRSALGIVLQYPPGDDPLPEPRFRTQSHSRADQSRPARGAIAVIGAGNYATRTLIPAIAAAGARVEVVAARGGVSAGLAADRAGTRASSDIQGVLDDPAIDTVFIATRHDSHASLAIQALRAGKATYVEKPLALSDHELDDLITAVDEITGAHGPILTVGFNRRFAPITVRMRELLGGTAGPKAVVVTVNAGEISADHWTQDREIGGGRIVGEGCHFIDLARHLVASPIVDVSTRYLGNTVKADTATVSLAFDDGSTAEVHYLANGSPRYAKERVEVFCQGRILVNENFRTLRPYGWPHTRTLRLRKQDKGHTAAVSAFLAAARDGAPPPIPFDDLVEVSRATIAAGPSGA